VPRARALSNPISGPFFTPNRSANLGIYIGKPSEPHVREAIETSDCLLAIGYRPLEVTTGDFSAALPADTIHARSHSVDVGDDNYQAVTLKEVLNGVIDAIPRVTSRAPRPVAPSGGAPYRS
jgi:indolepyruvate decarboxylase